MTSGDRGILRVWADMCRLIGPVLNYQLQQMKILCAGNDLGYGFLFKLMQDTVYL